MPVTLKPLRELLFNNPTSSVALIAVVASHRPPRMSRGDDWIQFMGLVDDSTHTQDLQMSVNVFRKRVDMLPQIRCVGDIVVFVELKTQKYASKNQGVGYRTTKFALFSGSDTSPMPYCVSHISDAPIFQEAYLRSEVDRLRNWYQSVNQSNSSRACSPTMSMAPTNAPTFSRPPPQYQTVFTPVVLADTRMYPTLPVEAIAPTLQEPFLSFANVSAAPMPLSTTLTQKQEVRLLVKLSDLDNNVKFFDFVGQVLDRRDQPQKCMAYLSDYTTNPNLSNLTAIKADVPIDSILTVTLWEVHGEAMIKNCPVGTFVHLKNLKMKLANGLFEAVLHSDNDSIKVISLDANDSMVTDLLKRRDEYLRQLPPAEDDSITFNIMDMLDKGKKGAPKKRVQKAQPAVKSVSSKKKSNRPVLTVGQIRESQYCDVVGKVIQKHSSKPEILLTDFTSNDGLTYVTRGISVPANQVLKVTFWDNYIQEAHDLLEVGSYCLLQNLRPKRSIHTLECNLHGDERGGKIHVLPDDDEDVKIIRKREKEVMGSIDATKPTVNKRLKKQKIDENTSGDKENEPTITPVGRVLQVMNLPETFKCRVKFIEHSPEDLRDFAAKHCNNCSKVYARRFQACPGCDDKSIRYVFQFALLATDNDVDYIPVLFRGNEPAVLLGVNPCNFEENKEATDKLSVALRKFMKLDAVDEDAKKMEIRLSVMWRKTRPDKSYANVRKFMFMQLL